MALQYDEEAERLIRAGALTLSPVELDPEYDEYADLAIIEVLVEGTRGVHIQRDFASGLAERDIILPEEQPFVASLALTGWTGISPDALWRLSHEPRLPVDTSPGPRMDCYEALVEARAEYWEKVLDVARYYERGHLVGRLGVHPDLFDLLLVPA